MKLKRLRFRTWRVSAAIGAVVIAASSISAGASAASHRASQAPITLGVDVQQTGPLAPFAVGELEFFKAYINYVNAHGGIDGRHINVISLDDKSDPGQALLNYETLWGQDHVLAIDDNFGSTLPPSYIRKNQVPIFGSVGTEEYSSPYTSVFSLGGQAPAWSAQTAYWIVKILHRPVHRVAVIYSNSFDQGFVPFIHNYWTKLGATFQDFVPDQGPNADCTAYVLKWKSENIQYIDMQGLEEAQCILAEARIGWKPPLGEGGPLTSQIGEAELIGKPYVGIVAGSPNTLYTGAPIYSHPTAVDKTYVGNIRKYYPNLANYDNLNGTGQAFGYGIGILMVAAIKGTIAKYGTVNSKLLMQYAHSMSNFSTGLQPPVISFASNCKTGADGTIWGFWHYNPHPTVAKPELYMIPSSGPNWVTNSWLGVSKCYLTDLANKLFPNG
jgi:hypothetical protein